jgi:hypothetical protein
MMWCGPSTPSGLALLAQSFNQLRIYMEAAPFRHPMGVYFNGRGSNGTNDVCCATLGGRPGALPRRRESSRDTAYFVQEDLVSSRARLLDTPSKTQIELS